MIRIIVTGSRWLEDRELVVKQLDEQAMVHGWDNIHIIHGNCKTGADHFADEWAKDNEVPCTHWDAKWHVYGSAAGQIRNREMAADGADLVLAFPRGVSRGTRGAMEFAQEFKIPVYEF